MINEAEIAEGVKEKREELFSAIARKVRSHIINLSPSEVLTLRLLDGERLALTAEPKASESYVAPLISFMRKKQYRGYNVDSYVTPVAVQATEEAIIGFYTSEEVSNVISNKILTQLSSVYPVDRSVRDGISENVQWLSKEASFLSQGDMASSVVVEATNVMTNQIAEFLQTTTGHMVLKSVTHALSTAAGKVALKEMITLVVKKVAASAALKTAIITTLKKVSLAAIMKTVIGKVIIAALALVGIAHVPVMWIVLPIIAAFLVYEYNHFPTKLADKIPDEIVSSIRPKFEEINKSIVSSIVEQSWKAIQSEITKPRHV